MEKFGRRTWWWVIVAALVVSTVWTGWASAHGRDLRNVPIALVGPDVVTGPISVDVERVWGSTLEVETAWGRDAARAALSRGDVLAVIELDLSGTADRLLLPVRRDGRRDVRLIREVRAVADTYDRTVQVERLNDPSGDHEVWLARALSVPIVALAAVGLGLLVTAGVSVLRGPVAATLVAGARRFLILFGASSIVAGGLLAAGLDRPSSLALGLACLGAGTFGLVCEVVVGLRGLIVAALLLGAGPLPLVVVGDLWLLDEPWAFVADWTLVGAASEILTSAPTADFAVRAVVVLVGTPALSVLLLLGVRLAGHRMAQHTSGPEAGRRSSVGEHAHGVEGVRLQVVACALGCVVFTVASYSTWAALTHEEPARATPSLASTTRCLQTGDIDTVADLNRITRLRGTKDMRGGDVGASARLQDGRMLWMFGDTIQGAGTKVGGFVRNSMLLVAPGCLEVVLPESGGAIIPDRDDGVGYWPMSVLVSHRPGYDLVAVTAQRVRTADSTDVFGFENLGPAVAVYIVPVGKSPQLISRTDVGRDSSDTTRPTWGAATVVHDEMAYLYGTARPRKVELGTGFSLSVARVPVDRIDHLEDWRYWTGDEWSADRASAATLIPNRGGVSQTLSVFTHGGRWYALSKRNDFLGRDLVIWTAPGPEGPFTAHDPVAALPSDAAAGLLRYMPLAHPDLLPRRGTVVVSYSQNRTDLTEVLEDPRRYRPRFLRVQLPSP